MTELEMQRLEDFKRVLTYRLVSKISHDFKGKYKLYFEAPCIWQKWKNKQIDYDKQIYKLVIMFNNTSLSAHQVQSIFGKDSNKKWIAYQSLIEQDKDIKVFNKGTICMNGSRYQVRKRYQLPFELIEKIFTNPELLKKVLDAGSDYYTPRQRRLIFTQINDKKKNYHYMTKQQKLESMSDDEKVAALMDEIGDIL